MPVALARKILKVSIRTWLIVGVLVLVLYSLLGFLLVPKVVRSQLLAFTTDNLHRPATVGEIFFNPFTLVLETHDFALPDAEGAPMLGFKRLMLDLDVSSVWRGASLAAVELEQPFAHAVQRKDGALNLADLSPKSATLAPPSSDPPPGVFIDQLTITDGHLSFEDQARAKTFVVNLRPITFQLREFSTRGSSGNFYALQGASSAGEKFSWDGSFTLAPLTSHGKFRVTDLHATTVSSYLADAVAFDFSKGAIGLAGEYEFTSGDTGDLTFNVHKVALSDVGLKPKGHDLDYIEITNLDVDETRLALKTRRVDIGKVMLDGGIIRAARDAGGHVNLLELAGTQTPAATAEPGTVGVRSTDAPPSAGTRWLLAAPDVTVQNLRVELEDALVQPTAKFVIAPIGLHVGGFSTASGSELTADLEAVSDTLGKVSVKGIRAANGALTARVDTEGLNFAALQPYVSTYTQTTLASGALRTGLDLERGADGSLAVKGDVWITSLKTIDSALKQDLVKWEEVAVSGIQYSSHPARLRIARIAAKAPYARVIIAPDQTLNITRLMQPAAGKTPAAVQTVRDPHGERHAPGGNPGGLAVSVGRIDISNASANFADFWITPNYAVSLQELGGSIVGLSSDPKSRAKVELRGKVDRYAPAQIGGEINLLSAALYSDLKVKFDGVELTSVTPYSGRFAGYQIEKGKLSIDVAYKIEDRQLSATQKFVIDQLQLGDRVDSPDAIHLPLKLAVALLKDRNGVIDIDLPLTGSLDDPKFRVGPLIWKAFLGLLTKIATSPFALLGRLGGGGDEQINQIDFEAGSTALSVQAQERLKAVAKGLAERPELQLDIPGLYSADIDTRALATQRIDEKLAAIGSAPAGDDAARFDLMVRVFQKDFGAGTPLPAIAAATQLQKRKKDPATHYASANNELTLALIGKQGVTESSLDALATARADAIRDVLLAGSAVEPARVFMLGAKAAPVVDGHVRVELALK
jgi:hypothetical protein